MKRYTLLIPTLDIKDNVTDKVIRGDAIVKLLNEQDDKIEQLSVTNDKLEKEVLSSRRALTVYRKIVRMVAEDIDD